MENQKLIYQKSSKLADKIATAFLTITLMFLFAAFVCGVYEVWNPKEKGFEWCATSVIFMVVSYLITCYFLAIKKGILEKAILEKEHKSFNEKMNEYKQSNRPIEQTVKTKTIHAEVKTHTSVSNITIQRRMAKDIADELLNQEMLNVRFNPEKSKEGVFVYECELHLIEK